MKLGLLGFGGAGKTTLFRCLTHGAGVTEARLSGLACSLSSVPVPDERLDRLSEALSPSKTVPDTLEVYDFPALRGTGTEDARVLASAREADVLLLVLRAFDDPTYPHPAGSVDAARDADELRTLFPLADLEVMEKRIEKLRVSVTKPTDKQEEEKKELALLEQLRARVDAGESLVDVDIAPEDEKRIAGFRFLSRKPMVPVRNVAEDAMHDACPDGARALCARTEAELLELPPDERADFMADYGLSCLSAPSIIAAAHAAAGLVTFYTIASDELRAWSVPRRTAAPAAAGRIHTDMERGFIRAEVAPWQEVVRAGRSQGQGLFRLEGKKYEVQDGDVVTFRFSV